MHPNIVTASILAIFSAVNRIAARGITVTPAAEASDGCGSAPESWSAGRSRPPRAYHAVGGFGPTPALLMLCCKIPVKELVANKRSLNNGLRNGYAAFVRRPGFFEGL